MTQQTDPNHLSDADLERELIHSYAIVSRIVASVHGVLDSETANRYTALKDEYGRRKGNPSA